MARRMTPEVSATFNQVGGVAMDALVNTYVADSGNNCIHKSSKDTFGIDIPEPCQCQFLLCIVERLIH